MLAAHEQNQSLALLFEEFRKMQKSSLDESTKLFALENLGESEEVAEDSVLKIQNFLRDNPSINAHSDERTILCFLRSNKFNIQQTELKIKK